MHRTLLRLLLIVSLWVPVPVAWPKDREVPPPLFMAQDFRFNQIDAICVAPAIDVRADKTEPLGLSDLGPRVNFQRIKNIDTQVSNDFKTIGYPTVTCNPVDATLGDLKTPTDAWLDKLPFGESRWLFILAVEDLSTEYHHRWSLEHSMGGYAVVSGYLFDKQAAGVRLVWRDRVVGRANSRTGGELFGRPEGVQLIESDYAIGQAARYLLAKFESRQKRIESWGFVKVHSETFDVTCKALWSALNDTLENSGKYTIVSTDAPDMMAIYGVGRGKKEAGRMDYVVLRPQENSCALQLIETFNLGFGSDVGGLNKRVKESLLRAQSR